MATQVAVYSTDSIYTSTTSAASAILVYSCFFVREVSNINAQPIN